MSKRQKAILFLILLAALFLRLPQINFPSIGYHNMKENEYISMAKNMLRHADYVTREVSFYEQAGGRRDFGLYPQIPFVAYQIALGFKLFGNDSLWFPRLVNILYMLAAILVVFFVAMKLTGAFVYSSAAAFLLAIFPVPVFFSRNLQPESGAFLFMALGTLSWLRFISDFKGRRLFACGCFFALSAAFKMAFLAGLVPLLAVFPYRRYIAETGWRKAGRDIFLFISPFVIFFAYCFLTGQFSFNDPIRRLNFLEFFSGGYWQKCGSSIWNFAYREMLSPVFFLLAAGGMVLAVVNIRRDKSLLAGFLRGWFLAIILYLIVLYDYTWQHSYYFLPFALAAALAVMYLFRRAASVVPDRLVSDRSRLFLLLFILAVALALPGVARAVTAEYMTLFPGGDAAGEFLKRVTPPGEKFAIVSGCQGYAPCVYSERECRAPAFLEELTDMEEEGTRFVVVSPLMRLRLIPQDMREHIEKNYHVRAAMLSPAGQALYPVVVILEKGGVLDLDAFVHNDKLAVSRSDYSTLVGDLPLFVLKNEEGTGR